ncbi:D-alanyl-D-alanine carboxypeptidase/D-alanyl-D-alanine-endopeptidase [Propionicimonas sp.]|uniref:D-alanyl-D-alanine carboxypeptidase/D-alanyl-D-alanine endopeptidase n=1 Tax=Propionicimonas sp. TaxID=1955623 RepID=UPI001D2BC75D|nr:D-alanyl-D-alanine carboxypeptidase/D-alanyl-D-alanine-endopeptidase [Propionicimonas sp.]MBU3975519.1 D-alanyl-D-alanine carboxypeptidase/D-alanyl-D-alanine-endopeptidase [Actinomycetota bacterium]MBU3986332.1 D-alanyl-D-alanine carboxypeptidase/D-alanyl-D-alanine-endopeptidase [Actinomycetota bacterium]MBU4007901.1 D-alanyl-D-alanine carboxypeptidase/D-alanyl-D-alanine-endopeptidase [Actinomycetota bacterium]MBU4064159.1 D-alanyl-D-alanine carboxypeptidase/D-alanyl-D-alanine-endopeptidase 
MLAAPLAAVVLAGCAVPASMAAQPQVEPTPGASASAAPLPEPAQLTTRLAQVSTAKIDRVAVTVTTTDGIVLAARSGTKPLTPASTMKVVTTMAAVDILGADHRFTTKAVDAGNAKVILVGGGDPVLTDKSSTSVYKRASLQRLAAATAAALKAKGQTQITLGYDASLFSGPTFSPYWKKKWKGTEARVAALEISSGKVGWRAQANPPLTAAKAFASRLKKAGIKVSKIAAAKASAGASELASVTSASLAMIIKRTLLISDNVGAETLSRHASLANGHAGSFSSASANVKDWLSAKGLWASGLKILDGSGLAPGSKLSTETLAKAMRAALAEPTYVPVTAGLPVAWETGTLAKRFDDKSEKAGRHNVHAKTGTLRGVAGLVGYLTTKDGARLVFAELANTSKPVSYTRLYNWLDRTAAATITCSCR